MKDPEEAQTYVALQGGLSFEDYAVPEHTQGSLLRYFNYHYEPGGFVTSVLAMDYETANARADSWNKHFIDDIFRWVKDNMPEECYGSYEKVHAWCSKQ